MPFRAPGGRCTGDFGRPPAPSPSPAARRRPAALLPDLAPWRSSRDFRLLWCAGAITVFGTFLTVVALPLQLKQLTGSTLAGGALGAVELAPLVVFGLYGGALADFVDRRVLIIGSEPALGLISALLLALAGACDMISGIFRSALWNRTIPDELRGRLAGIELLSYATGPQLGQVRDGGPCSLRAWGRDGGPDGRAGVGVGGRSAVLRGGRAAGAGAVEAAGVRLPDG